MECFKILALGLFLSFNLSAQSDTTAYREVGIGFGFINSLLPLDNNIGSNNSSYHVYYNKIKGNKHSRWAFRLNLDGSIENDDVQESKTRINLIDFRFQYASGKSKNVYKGFDLIYGWKISPSLLFSQQQTESIDDPDDDTKRTIFDLQIGTGPFTGLQYHAGYNVSIYLETSYQLFVSFRSDSFETTPGFADFETKAIDYTSVFTTPTQLILQYRF